MIHVLIAEDEPPTLRRIAALVEQDPAFSVIATAMNGREALRKMSENHVDVLLTDIRMPVMDGTELIAQVRKQYPECMIVVLSGYQDFEYMAHAIRAQSLDYLLKPMSTGAMHELLSRIKEQYMRLSRERITKELSAHLSRASLARTSDTRLGLCLFCAGGMPIGEDAEMYPGAEIWSGISLEQLAQQIVPGFASFTWEFMGNTPVERIFIFQSETQRYAEWVECLHAMLIDEAKLPVSCIFMSEEIVLGEINAALKVMRDVLKKRIRIGRSLITTLKRDLKPDEETPDEAERAEEDAELAAKLAELLSQGRMASVSPFRCELFQRMEREGWTQQRVAGLFQRAINLMENDSSEAVRRLAQQYAGALIEAVSACTSFKSLEQELSSLPPLQDIAAHASVPKQSNTVDGIERYLRDHYADHITNQTLAAVFGYVPSYISVLFRQKYQRSPSEYLTEICIAEAKKLLQENPDMLIREVADRVGFKNQHHFSRIFKKKEGMWPTSFQS